MYRLLLIDVASGRETLVEQGSQFGPLVVCAGLEARAMRLPDVLPSALLLRVVDEEGRMVYQLPPNPEQLSPAMVKAFCREKEDETRSRKTG